MKSIISLIAFLSFTCFSIYADSWIQKADFAGSPRGFAVGFVINEKGYIATGGEKKDMWQYDPSIDSWSQKADLPGDGRIGAAGFVIATKGYLGTGQNDIYYYDDFWEYDSDANIWMQKANFPGGKRSFSFAFAIESKGYIGGGSTTSAKKDFWEYDPSTDSWTQKTDYGGGKISGANGFVIADKAYIGTGRDNDLAYRDDFWEYDPITDIWTQKADFAGGVRAGSIGFSINNLGYLCLGYVLDTNYNDFWQYNFGTDSWIQKSDYPESGYATGISIDGKGFMGTGDDIGNHWWEYDPDTLATIVGEEFSTPKLITVFPDPIISSSNISFSLLQNAMVSLELLNPSGNKIKTLVNKNLEAGNYNAQLNREQLSGGIYFLKIKFTHIQGELKNESSIIKIVIQ